MVRRSSLHLLEQALDVASYRQRLLSDNIANAETPGYKRKDIAFSTQIKRALAGKVTHPQHIAINSRPVGPVTPVVQESTARNDGNNVDIEVEMAELAKNTLYYQGLARQVSQYLANLRMVISEGRR
ncbi:MAG TPA: flagellar basal body rod protein FlgB [Firmicutes bacterium]|jgi:flagellar basal-body rod protein FlgB|nr:flagellar basal body rod protein FlgB [Bacillota bacterium]